MEVAKLDPYTVAKLNHGTYTPDSGGGPPRWKCIRGHSWHASLDSVIADGTWCEVCDAKYRRVDSAGLVPEISGGHLKYNSFGIDRGAGHCRVEAYASAMTCKLGHMSFSDLAGLRRHRNKHLAEKTPAIDWCVLCSRVDLKPAKRAARSILPWLIADVADLIIDYVDPGQILMYNLAPAAPPIEYAFALGWLAGQPREAWLWFAPRVPKPAETNIVIKELVEYNERRRDRQTLLDQFQGWNVSLWPLSLLLEDLWNNPTNRRYLPHLTGAVTIEQYLVYRAIYYNNWFHETRYAWPNTQPDSVDESRLSDHLREIRYSQRTEEEVQREHEKQLCESYPQTIICDLWIRTLPRNILRRMLKAVPETPVVRAVADNAARPDSTLEAELDTDFGSNPELKAQFEEEHDWRLPIPTNNDGPFIIRCKMQAIRHIDIFRGAPLAAVRDSLAIVLRYEASQPGALRLKALAEELECPTGYLEVRAKLDEEPRASAYIRAILDAKIDEDRAKKSEIKSEAKNALPGHSIFDAEVATELFKFPKNDRGFYSVPRLETYTHERFSNIALTVWGRLPETEKRRLTAEFHKWGHSLGLAVNTHTDPQK